VKLYGFWRSLATMRSIGVEPRVDAHHHIWRVPRGDYHWLRPTWPIYRDYDLDDLRPLLSDVGATVLVQAAATEAETAFLLDAARNSGGLVRAVVGWTDLAATDAADRVRQLSGEPLLRGLRPMLQDIADVGWILRPELRPALTAMSDTALSLDLLIVPRHLPLVPELAQRHPDLRLVIDHGAKPAIAARAFEPWASDIARVARETRAFCKLSGLVTEAGPNWTEDDIRPYILHLLECFGPQRLMWGSDWPVVDMAGGYRAWRAVADNCVPAEAAAAVFGETARTFYRF
jgi:L-fuconolactonase